MCVCLCVCTYVRTCVTRIYHDISSIFWGANGGGRKVCIVIVGSSSR